MSVLQDGTDPACVDIWCQDEARVGRKGMLTRVRARRGKRPRVLRDHRYGYCQLFSAICPAKGAAVGHIRGRANTEEMNRHLLDIVAAGPQGRHALGDLDGAGRHRSKDLEVPEDVTLLYLPPCGPELNSTENVFRFLKASRFANQVFATTEAIREWVTAVWQEFAANPDRITLVGNRRWAKIV